MDASVLDRPELAAPAPAGPPAVGGLTLAGRAVVRVDWWDRRTGRVAVLTHGPGPGAPGRAVYRGEVCDEGRLAAPPGADAGAVLARLAGAVIDADGRLVRGG